MLDPDSFGGLLLRHIRRRGWSYSETARLAGLNASIISRYCSGDKDSPERASVIGLARALALGPAERDALYASAGYLPPGMQRLGADDSTVRSVVALLGDDRLDPAVRADARAIVEAVCARFGQLASVRQGTQAGRAGLGPVRQPASPPARRAS